MTKSTSHLFYVQHINNNNTNRETRNSDFFLFVCVRFFCFFFFVGRRSFLTGPNIFFDSGEFRENVLLTYMFQTIWKAFTC